MMSIDIRVKKMIFDAPRAVVSTGALMLGTALSPVIGYDKASKIAHYAMDNDLTLRDAALKLGFVSEAEFDRVVDPKKMVMPYVVADAASSGGQISVW
jgi:fumarate hydratase class II